MVLLRQLTIVISYLLIISVTCFNDLDNETDGSPEEGDDDALKQALVLVELLRSEYMRVLRQNKMLVASMAASSGSLRTAAGNESSLPSPSAGSDRDHEASAAQGTRVQKAQTPSSSPGSLANTTRVLLPTTQHHAFAHHYQNLFGSAPSRRFMKPPSDFASILSSSVKEGVTTKAYLGVVKKLNEEKTKKKLAGEPVSYEKQTTVQGVVSTTVTSLRRDRKKEKTQTKIRHPNSKVAEIAAELKKKDSNETKSKVIALISKELQIRKQKKQMAEKKMRHSKVDSKVDSKVAEIADKLKKKYNNDTKAQVVALISKELQKRRLKKEKTRANKGPRRNYQDSDPILAEIAFELLNELKDNPDGINALREKKEKQPDSIQENTYNTDQHNNKEFSHKTTMRIHLQQSSKLSLPLSENNPFCFYVPESPLCGAFKRK